MNIIHGRKAGSTILTALLGLLFWGGSVEAQVSPVEMVRERNEEVKQTLDAAGETISPETREELKDVINSLIDFQELSKRALRRHWDERSPEEREEFVELFRELVRNSSVQKLEVYKADSITYEPAEIEGGEARVVTTAHKGRSDAEIVYLMHKVGDEWLAYDVIIDGSSTLRTYQDSFQREIRATSYEAMYNRMMDRLEQDRTGVNG